MHWACICFRAVNAGAIRICLCRAKRRGGGARRGSPLFARVQVSGEVTQGERTMMNVFRWTPNPMVDFCLHAPSTMRRGNSSARDHATDRPTDRPKERASDHAREDESRKRRCCYRGFFAFQVVKSRYACDRIYFRVV